MHHPCFGQHENRQVPQLVVRADLGNDTQRIDILQAEAHHEAVATLGHQAVHEIARLVDAIHDMVLAERDLHAVCGIGAILDDEDAPVAAILGGGNRQRIGKAERLRACSTGAQFIREVLQAHEAADAGEQRDFVDRLREEIIGTA